MRAAIGPAVVFIVACLAQDVTLSVLLAVAAAAWLTANEAASRH